MKHFFISFLCFLLIFCCCFVPASATDYFTPFSAFPYAEALPYGSGTLVFEFKYSQDSYNSVWYRFYLPPGSYLVLYKRGQYGGVSNACVAVYRPSPDESLVYYQYWAVSLSTGQMSTVSDVRTDRNQDSSGYYLTVLDSSIRNSDFVCYSSAPAIFLNDTVTFNSQLKVYPTSAQQMGSEVVSAVDGAASQISDELSKNASQISGELSQNHSEIMNAGQDQSTLDTDNNWMNDSLTKVNGWLDDLSDFEQQMSRNRVDNSVNMSKAGSFLSDFFGGLPTAIIAAMGLCLVMIVVIKIVGR